MKQNKSNRQIQDSNCEEQYTIKSPEMETQRPVTEQPGQMKKTHKNAKI